MSLRNPLQKMSKSDNQEMSQVTLTDSPDEIRKKIRRAVTDCTSRVTFDPTGRPGVSNLVAIYSAVTGLSTDEVCSRCEGKETVDLKDQLADILIEALSPIRAKILELEKDERYLDEILKNGAERARVIAEENIASISRLVGLS